MVLRLGPYQGRRKAETAVKKLITALIGLGYPEPKAVEVAENVLDRAGKDGLKTEDLWNAIEKVAPIPTST